MEIRQVQLLNSQNGVGWGSGSRDFARSPRFHLIKSFHITIVQDMPNLLVCGGT